ncbi:MAG TPA: T9SS type A sorting domain-containing protein, partial [Ignavibacteriaceae bacterium]|nr:T9SS type A sorting domain-containing protein [Ignavibacteriaceae bacterium]
NHLLPSMILAAGDISKNGKQELVIINGNFAAPGAGGRIIVLEAKAVTVAVEEEKGFLPEKYELAQNYPNPFNPSTRINYYIPKETLVKLDVYNILGQNVAQLVNEMQVAGKYEVTFNADNFASGIYFYQIKADQFIQVKKMILLK